jgi:uncharacterized protein (TIGR02266 family)
MDRIHVLVAEGEAPVGDTIVGMLAELSLEVSVVTDGRETLQQARAIRPRLVLLDAMLPGLDGFQVAEALKADAATRDIAIIFITANWREEDKIRGLELGAEDYIIKPIKREELLARVRNILRRVETRRPAPTPETSLVRGRLEMISLPNLIQALEAERQTGTLRVISGRRRGEIFFSDGRVASAMEGVRQGEAAVYRMLTWTEGEFALDPAASDTPPEAAVTMSNQSLLLEGARRLDEIGALRQALASLEDPVRMLPALREGLLHRGLPGGVCQVAELCDGTRTAAQLIEASSLDEWETVTLLARFLKLGMLEYGQTAKRSFPRLGIQVPVDFQALQSFPAGTSFDVSARGIFVRTGQVVPVGQEILLRFTLPGVSRAFRTVGRVIWSSPVETAEGYPAGMGIQFLDLPAEEQAIIEEYVVQQLLDRAVTGGSAE